MTEGTLMRQRANGIHAFAPGNGMEEVDTPGIPPIWSFILLAV